MMHHVVSKMSARPVSQALSKHGCNLCRSLSSSTNNAGGTTTRNNGPNNNDAKNTSAVNASAFNARNTGAAVSSVGSSTTPGSIGRSGAGTTTAALANPGLGGGAKNSYSNRASSDNDGTPEFRSVYVHPLSQIVLEYMQDSYHGWIVAKGLDRSLLLHRDGSFELKHLVDSPMLSRVTLAGQPPLPSIGSANNNNNSATTKKELPGTSSGPEPPISAPTSPTAVARDETTNNATTTTAKQSTATTIATSTTVTVDDKNSIRIWTSYDEQEKKHWLTVRKGLFRQRFLLQDNLLTAWQGNRGISLPERLHVAVDEMIRAIDRLDRQEEQQEQQTGNQHWQQKGRRRFRKP